MSNLMIALSCLVYFVIGYVVSVLAVILFEDGAMFFFLFWPIFLFCLPIIGLFLLAEKFNFLINNTAAYLRKNFIEGEG